MGALGLHVRVLVYLSIVALSTTLSGCITIYTPASEPTEDVNSSMGQVLSVEESDIRACEIWWSGYILTLRSAGAEEGAEERDYAFALEETIFYENLLEQLEPLQGNLAAEIRGTFRSWKIYSDWFAESLADGSYTIVEDLNYPHQEPSRKTQVYCASLFGENWSD